MQRSIAALVAAFAFGGAHAIELTKETWDSAVAGKTVFVKFLAPWWGHCKAMKPHWDKLMAKYADSKDVLIADVDCTAGGEELCQEVGVEGYPTIKHGDPADLQDYEGGRELEDLEKFAAELGPTCGPNNLDLCDAEKKAKIAEFQAMSADKLQEFIDSKEEEKKKVESEFEKFVEGLQSQYEEAEKKKKADIAAVKDSGLGAAKAVKAAAASGSDKKEL